MLSIDADHLASFRNFSTLKCSPSKWLYFFIFYKRCRARIQSKGPSSTHHAAFHADGASKFRGIPCAGPTSPEHMGENRKKRLSMDGGGFVSWEPKSKVLSFQTLFGFVYAKSHASAMFPNDRGAHPGTATSG